MTAFNEAPGWNQEFCLAKQDVLKCLDDFLAAHLQLGKVKGTRRFVELFNNGMIHQGLKDRVKDGRISKDKLRNWRNDFDKYGLDGLLYGWNNGGCRIDLEAREVMERLVWRNHLCRFMDVYEDLELLVNKDKRPSYSTVRNYVMKYKADNWAALVLCHEGRKGLRDRNMEVVLGQADGNIVRPNQRWEIDTTIADIFTGRRIQDTLLKMSDGKRCQLIGVIDVFSRSARFYLVEAENSLAVALAIKDRILAWGMPEEIVIDNGKPFKNRRILAGLRSFQIAVNINLPGEPVEKPFIERVFGTMTGKLFRRLPGYCGNSVANRPNEIEIKYTKAELQDIIDRYVTNVYAETVHGSTGQRPRERMSPPGFTPKMVSEHDLDILLMEKFERIVRRGHIAFDNGKFFHPKLPEGRKVTVRPNDFEASELLVFVDNRPLCTAVDWSRQNKTRQQIKEARKARNNELRTRIKAHEALLKKHDGEPEGVLATIDYHEERKPAELPKKAKVLEFSEAKGGLYTSHKAENQDLEKAYSADQEGHEVTLIRNKQEMYLDVEGRRRAGKALDDFDKKFLEEFLASSEYEMIGSFLDKQVEREVANVAE